MLSGMNKDGEWAKPTRRHFGRGASGFAAELKNAVGAVVWPSAGFRRLCLLFLLFFFFCSNFSPKPSNTNAARGRPRCAVNCRVCVTRPKTRRSVARRRWTWRPRGLPNVRSPLARALLRPAADTCRTRNCTCRLSDHRYPVTVFRRSNLLTAIAYTVEKRGRAHGGSGSQL